MDMEIDTYLSRSRYLWVCKARLLDEAGRLGLGIISYTQKQFSWMEVAYAVLSWLEKVSKPRYVKLVSSREQRAGFELCSPLAAISSLEVIWRRTSKDEAFINVFFG